MDSRRLLATVTSAQALGCVALIFLHQFIPIVLLAATVGVGGAFSVATWQALIPRVVGEAQIGRAVAASQTCSTMAMIGAPAAGGLLCGAFGTGVPLAVDAASFALLTVAVFFIRTRRRGDHAGQPKPFRDGWAVIRNDPLIRLLVVSLGSFVMMGMMVNVVMVYLVRATLHASTIWFGAIEAFWMVGVVFGSAGAGRLTTDRARIRAITLGAAVMSVVFVGYGLTPTIVLLAPLALVGGVGNGAVNVCVSTVVTTRTEDRLRGRVAAAVGGVLGGASMVSLIAGGALPTLLSTRQVYLVAAGLSALVTSVLVARTTASWRHMPVTSP
jgi:MFS family permease